MLHTQNACGLEAKDPDAKDRDAKDVDANNSDTKDREAKDVDAENPDTKDPNAKKIKCKRLRCKKCCGDAPVASCPRVPLPGFRVSSAAPSPSWYNSVMANSTSCTTPTSY